MRASHCVRVLRDMKVFLAGAAGAIGRRLVPLLLRAGHEVTGTTRSPQTAKELERAGVTPAVLDIFDAPEVIAAVRAAAPAVVIHQLTDLPQERDPAKIAASYPNNARIRTEGTRHLLAAAQAAGAGRVIVQSIAFAYAPGGEPHPESDPLNLADPARAATVKGAADMERQVLAASGFEGIVLRYGLLYGPGTWYPTEAPRPALHVDAAAQAALLAMTRGRAGIYNIADDDGVVAIAKARDELGFDPHFRLDKTAL
jgi:nucleoside-diphosphate-sugar epimerase